MAIDKKETLGFLGSTFSDLGKQEQELMKLLAQMGPPPSVVQPPALNPTAVPLGDYQRLLDPRRIFGG